MLAATTGKVVCSYCTQEARDKLVEEFSSHFTKPESGLPLIRWWVFMDDTALQSLKQRWVELHKRYMQEQECYWDPASEDPEFICRRHLHELACTMSYSVAKQCVANLVCDTCHAELFAAVKRKLSGFFDTHGEWRPGARNTSSEETFNEAVQTMQRETSYDNAKPCFQYDPGCGGPKLTLCVSHLRLLVEQVEAASL